MWTSVEPIPSVTVVVESRRSGVYNILYSLTTRSQIDDKVSHSIREECPTFVVHQAKRVVGKYARNITAT